VLQDLMIVLFLFLECSQWSPIWAHQNREVMRDRRFPFAMPDVLKNAAG